MSEIQRINQETKAYNDQHPQLRELWQEHDGEFKDFTDFLEKNVGSLVLWRIVESDKPYRVWQRTRVEEDLDG